MLTTTTAKTWHNALGRELVTLTSDGVVKVHPLTVNEGELRALVAACLAAADELAVVAEQREVVQ